MRTAIVALTLISLTVLLAVTYHLKAQDRWADRLRDEQAAHALTRAQLTACQSASRAECAVARAQEGKADAREALGALIKERKK